MADLYLRFKLRIELKDNEIHACVYALVISYQKQNKELMLFAAVSGAPACCITPKGDVNFSSRPLQKCLFDISGMLQIQFILPLTTASAVVLNEHRRFLF